MNRPEKEREPPLAEFISAKDIDFGSKPNSASERLMQQAIKGEYRYANLGLVLGLAAILGGVILGLHGVTGSTSWTAEILGLKSHINDAAPGVVLFVVGVFFVFITRPKVKLDKLRQSGG